MRKCVQKGLKIYTHNKRVDNSKKVKKSNVIIKLNVHSLTVESGLLDMNFI